MFPAPDPKHAVPCPFGRCWIGLCGNTDRTKCQHNYDYKRIKGKSTKVFGQDIRCSCGRPAMGECEATMGLVCGAPICNVWGNCGNHGGSHNKGEVK